MTIEQLCRAVYRGVRSHVLHYVIPAARRGKRPNFEGKVEVIGFLRSGLGIGEGARLCIDDLRRETCSVACTSVERFFGKPETLDYPVAPFDLRSVTIRLFHLNPPMMPPVVLRHYARDFSRTYNVGYWAWELESLPPEWARATRYMDAILCPSNFTNNAIRRVFDGPVRTVHHPVPNISPHSGQAKAGRFTVSMIVNLDSGIERKNPLGGIEAFKRALGGDERAALIVKLDATDRFPEIEAAAAGVSNIQIVRKHWSRDVVTELLRSSDLYLSLHRSEGFGLTIAEAMAVGTPPVVTAWSGNMDFCQPDLAYLVPFQLVPVRSHHTDMAAVQQARWAEPDIEAASAIIRQAFINRSSVIQRGQRCFDHMQSWPRGGYLDAIRLMETSD